MFQESNKFLRTPTYQRSNNPGNIIILIIIILHINDILEN